MPPIEFICINIIFTICYYQKFEFMLNIGKNRKYVIVFQMKNYISNNYYINFIKIIMDCYVFT
jgi:hypothetical protein